MDWFTWLDGLFALLLKLLFALLPLASAGCASQLCVRIACEVPGLLLIEPASNPAAASGLDESRPGLDPRPNP